MGLELGNQWGSLADIEEEHKWNIGNQLLWNAFWEVATCWLHAVSVLGEVQHTGDYSLFRHSIWISHSLHYVYLLPPSHFAQYPFPQHSKAHNKRWFIPEELPTEFLQNYLLLKRIILQPTYYKRLTIGMELLPIYSLDYKEYRYVRYKYVKNILRKKLKDVPAFWIQKQKHCGIMEV